MHELYLSGNPRKHWQLRGKESSCQYKRRKFNPQMGKISQRRKWHPTPAFLPEKSQGQSSLVGSSLWGLKRVRHDLVTKQQQPRKHELQVGKCTVSVQLQCVTGLSSSGDLQRNLSRNFFRVVPCFQIIYFILCSPKKILANWPGQDHCYMVRGQ